MSLLPSPRRSTLCLAFCFLLPLIGCGSGLNRDVPPKLTGIALYRDANLNGTLDAGDTLTVTFDQNIQSLSGTAASSFRLPVAGDSLGTGATFAIATSTNQLIITLGTSPAFTARQLFSSSDVNASSPSGIDISTTIVAGAIVGIEGETAEASTPIDIAPAFSDSGQSFASVAARNIARGDFNGDGDDDIFLVAFGEGNRVLLDSGGGVFTDTMQSLGSAASLGAAVGDFDQDGDLDVAVANDSGATNQIWTNNGMGTFTAGPTFGTGQSRDVFAGDFDGDGRLDLAVANSGANTIWINQGGTFLDGGQTLGNASSRAVVAADFDADGDLDLAFANDNTIGQVWRNNGSASFISIADLTGPAVGTSIAAGDVDRDGFMDIVLGSLDRGLTTFVNTGPSSFTADPDFGGTSVRAVALGDVDGDGDLDLVEGRSGNFGDRIWFNDGSGFFDDSGMRLGAVSTYGVTLTDLGPDGDLDLVTATLSGSALVYQNPVSGSSGGFSLVDSGQDLRNNTTPADNVTLDALVFDLDGDGDLDYLNGASPNGAARVWLNDGTGVMVIGASLGAFGTAADAVAARNLDADADADILVGRGGQQTLIVRNDGAGSFTTIGSIPTSVGATQLRLLDLNGDGDADLVTDNGVVVRVLLGDGAGNFTDTGQTIGATTPGGISLALLDGDVFPDLVLGGSSGGTQVFLNNGSGTFTTTGQSLGTATTRDTQLGDVDGDGDLDLVEGNNGGNRVWLNNGSATFTDTLQSLGTDNTRRIALGDLDGDGDLDLIEANEGSDSRVRLNDGMGTFTDAGLTLVSAGTARTVALGDLDGDGDLDAVFGTTGGDLIYFRD